MDPTTPDPRQNDRYNIAIWVLGIAGGGLLVLAIAIIYNSPANDLPAATDKVFSAMLPLLGTWVGTVLAYYFSKENFSAASQSVQDMAKQLTSDEKLRGIPVKSKMILSAVMGHLKGNPAQLKLKDDILNYMDQHAFNRLPILDSEGKPLTVVHRSTVDKYLASGLLARTLTVDTAPTKTLQDLLADPVAQKMLANSFALVAEDASMGEAKAAMERIPECRDVFVTRTGQKTEPVLGWLTNITISEAARV